MMRRTFSNSSSSSLLPTTNEKPCQALFQSKRDLTGSGRRLSGSSSFSSGSLPVNSIIAFVIVIGLILYGKSQYDELKREYEGLVTDKLQWEIEQDELLVEVQQLQKQKLVREEGMEREITDMTIKAETAIARYEELEETTTKASARLKETVQSLYLRDALYEFGQGPHYIQFELDLHLEENGRQFFTVELAPVQQMPVSVYTFLRQTARGLWDNTAFFVCAHVLMSKPVSFTRDRNRYSEFESLDLAKLPFNEYHEDHPHETYTMGFGGHPAGPDFYVNMKDNTIPHGPKGVAHVGDTAEPCFAKVIIGKDTIDNIRKLPSQEENQVLLETPVTIVSVRLLNNLSEAVGGDEYLAEREL